MNDLDSNEERSLGPYLLSLSRHDMDLIIQALDYMALQELFGVDAHLARSMSTDLEALMKRQDA